MFWRPIFQLKKQIELLKFRSIFYSFLTQLITLEADKNYQFPD